MANEKQMLVKYETSRGEIELNRAYAKQLCPKADDVEIFDFLRFCQFHRLNPFLKEVYLVKYQSGEKASIVVDYHVYMRRAREEGHITGYKSGLILEADNAQGFEKCEMGAFAPPKRKVLGAWCDVYRDDMEMPVSVALTREEMDKGMFLWKKNPNLMMEKTVISQAHRRASDGALQGMYTDTEMETNGGLVIDQVKEEGLPPYDYAEGPAGGPETTEASADAERDAVNRAALNMFDTKEDE